MKTIKILSCIIITSMLFNSTIITGQSKLPDTPVTFPVGLDTRQSCTILYASDSKNTLAGNNEDWNKPYSNIWFVPAEKGKFGRIYFGFNVVQFPQGGMNEKGLFFDGATAETVIVPRDSSKLDYEGGLILKAMEECSTVEEVLKLYDSYDVSGSWGGHYLIGDRFGNSAIIEPLTTIKKKGKYQIITNFFQSKIKPESITDTRYRIASKIFEESKNISVDLFRRILNATHWEDGGSRTNTIYSYICDLKKGDIYIYNFHNFEDVVKINILEELKKGKRFHSITSLFPYETFAQNRYKSERIIGLIYEKALLKGVEGPEGAFSYYKEMKSGNNKIFKFDVSQKQLNSVGYRLLKDNKINEAVEIFKFEITEYPESANAYNSLGEAHMKAGRKKLAILNYEKSLLLDPNNTKSKWKLESLKAPKTILIDKATMKAISGKYGERTIFIKDSTLYYQKDSNPELRLLPISKELFYFKEFDYYRIKIIKKNNQVIAIEGMYEDGRNFRYERAK